MADRAWVSTRNAREAAVVLHMRRDRHEAKHCLLCTIDSQRRQAVATRGTR
jgi:hypothetical protein